MSVMKKYLLFTLLLLILYIETISAQNMAYENGSWWLPDIEVVGYEKEQCSICGKYYNANEPMDHECTMECEYCYETVLMEYYDDHIRYCHPGMYKDDNISYCPFCNQQLEGDEAYSHNCQNVGVSGSCSGGGGNYWFYFAGGYGSGSSSGKGSSSGSDGGNNSESGSNTGSTTVVTRKKTQKDKIKTDCDSVPQSKMVKQAMKNILDGLDKTSGFDIGNQKYHALDAYLDSLSDKPSLERGASYDFIRDYGDNDYYGVRIFDLGTESRAEIIPFNTTVVDLHNHPNQSAPSPQDLFLVADLGTDTKKYPHYQGEIIIDCYKNDTVMYFMMVNDREELKNLRDSLENEIDSNNYFRTGGKCEKYLRINKRSYKPLNKNEKLLTKLMLISDFFTEGKALEFVRYQWNSTEGRKKGVTTVYNIIESVSSKGKTKIKPVKC